MSMMMVKFKFTIMTPDPSLPTDSRRDFVKKSIAVGVVAAQPTILAGLIRAQGGGGGPTTTTAESTLGTVLLRENRTFAAINVTSTAAYESLAWAEAAAQGRLYQLIQNNSTAVAGTQVYGPVGTNIYQPYLVDGLNPVVAISYYQDNQGKWLYNITIAAGTYTVIYYIDAP